MDLFSNPRSIYFDQILISDRCTPNYNLPLVHNGSGAASKYCTFCNRVMIVLNEYSIYLSLRARNASISRKCYLTKSSRVAAGSEDNIFPHYKFKVLLGFQMLLFTGIYTVALGSVWLVSVIGTWGAQQFWLAAWHVILRRWHEYVKPTNPNRVVSNHSVSNCAVSKVIQPYCDQLTIASAAGFKSVMSL